jgi:hypothetical protein
VVDASGRGGNIRARVGEGRRKKERKGKGAGEKIFSFYY